MPLQQAIDIINRLALAPIDFPAESDWPVLQEAMVAIGQAIATQQMDGYSRANLVDMIYTTRMVLNIAQAGGYDSITRVLADEDASAHNWLETIAS